MYGKIDISCYKFSFNCKTKGRRAKTLFTDEMCKTKLSLKYSIYC